MIRPAQKELTFKATFNKIKKKLVKDNMIWHYDAPEATQQRQAHQLRQAPTAIKDGHPQ